MRALADSWQATAVMPMATHETPTHDAAKATEPVAGSPPATQASAASTPRVSATTADSSTAAASWASRPTAVPPSSSARPDSSSVRVWRRTSTRNSRAANTAYSTVSFVIASSPALVTSRIGP